MSFLPIKLSDWLRRTFSTAPIASQALADNSTQLYIKELGLYTAVGLLADLLAGCEFQFYRGDRPVRDGNWYAWNVSPNVNQSAAQLKTQLVTELYYRGEALVIPLGGQLFLADSFQLQEYPIRGDRFCNIALRSLQLQRSFGAADVCYFRQGERSVRAMVDGMFASYGALMASVADAGRRAGGEKYALELGRSPSGTPEEQKRYLDAVKENLQSFVDGRSAAYPLTGNQKLTRFSGSSSGGQAGDLTTLRRDVYNIISSVLHLPEGLMSGNANNVDQLTAQALTFALDPLARKLDSELTRKVYTRDEVLYQGCRVRVDTTQIGHADLLQMADQIDKLISSGVCCIDEVRRRCGLPELNTDWSQRHYLTRNYGDVESAADPLEGGEQP